MRDPSPDRKRTVLHSAVGVATGAVGAAGRVVTSTLRLPGFRRSKLRVRLHTPGASPGIEETPGIDVPPPRDTVTVQCIDYNAERVEFLAIDDIDGFLAHPRPEWPSARWINVDTLNPYVVNKLWERFGFHTLSAEDVLHVPQRPKVELYDDYIFIVAQVMTLRDDHLVPEQVSFLVYEDTLITIQERPGDVWQPIRDRIRKDGSRHRRHRVGYLLYTLLDAIVDHFFPMLEHYGDVFEELEEAVGKNPTPEVLRRTHAIKRELTVLRRAMWPTRELLDKLQRDEDDRLSDNAKTFLRDVHDHTIQIVDIIETYRDMTGVLTDLYLSSMSNRMNEVMKVLTVIATFFIPLTFLAGVYGMNFRHMPELDWKYSYGIFWLVCSAVTVGLYIYFRRKGWLGGK